MNIRQKVRFFIILISLQLFSLQASQPSGIAENNQKIIRQTILYHPELVEGFKLLGNGPDGFYNFLQKNIPKDAPADFQSLRNQAAQYIIRQTKQPFLDTLNCMIKSPDCYVNAVYNPLYEYVIKNRQGFMQSQLRSWINSQDKDGNTPLCLAASYDKDMHKKCMYDKAMYAKFMYKKLAEAQALLAMGADVTCVNGKGNTPLHEAIMTHYEPIEELLLHAGAPLNSVNKHGRTPLYFAILCDNQMMVRKLINNYRVNLHVKDNDGITLLTLAAAKNNEEALEMLLQQGVNPNTTGSCGNTLLHESVDSGNDAIIEILLDYDASPLIHNQLGYTPKELKKHLQEQRSMEDSLSESSLLRSKEQLSNSSYHA